MSNTLVQAVLVGSFLCASTWARDVTFPPVNGYQMPFSGSSAENPYNGIDVSSANFGGLTTYANLPYVHCLSEDEAKVEPYDIAILGAPFDTASLPNIYHPLSH